MLVPWKLLNCCSLMRAVWKSLLIDDNRGDRVLCERHLERSETGRFITTSVSCGAQALEAMESTRFDAVLLDYFLPDAVGLGLVDDLRQHASDPCLPVLMLTGSGDEDLAAHVLTHGVDDYLPKGRLSSRVLSHALINAVEKSDLRKQAARNHQLLEASNRELRDRNEEIRKFYQTVSHELKTPLTAIREYNSLLLDGIGGGVSEEQQDFLESSVECCDVLTRLVSDLYDTAGMEQGKLSLNSEYSDLGLLVSKLSPTLAILAEKGDIEYSCEIDRPLPCTMLDSDRITQLLTNLVSNATRHTDAGGSVSVRVQYDQAESELLLHVTDTGCGISETNQASVFGRFFQAHDNAETKHQGMGIGLYLCKSIAEMHDGEISLQSELGVGSTFTVRLPVVGES